MVAADDWTAAHRAFIYTDRSDYAAVVGRFLREGMKAGERTMVMAAPERLSWIRDELGADAADVAFTDSTGAHPIQSHAIRSMLQYLGRDHRPSRVVAEQHLAGRTPTEVRDHARMEAAANVMYRSLPVSILCPYDATVLAAEVLTTCRQTHPEMLDAAGLRQSPEFVDPRAFVTSRAAVVPPPASAQALRFGTPADVPVARQFVSQALGACGFGSDTAGEITVAAVEILTNALLHGRAPRTLYMYTESDSMVVHVHDSGPGLADPLAGFFPPSSALTHGRGLWMARQLCDTVEVASDLSGTHVRLVSRLPRAEESSPRRGQPVEHPFDDHQRHRQHRDGGTDRPHPGAGHHQSDQRG